MLDVVLASIFTVIVILGIKGLLPVWRNEARLYDRTPAWFPYSDVTWRATRRSMTPATIGAVPLTVGGWITVLYDSRNASSLPAGTKMLILAPIIAALVLLVVAALVFLFAQPKILIPPHLRGERGWIRDHRDTKGRSA